MVRWKSDNITILKHNTDTLINMLLKFSTTLIDLLKEIKTDIYKTYPKESSWSWLSRSVSSERKIIEKLDELETKTVTLRTELDMLKTAFTELLASLFRCLQTIIDSFSFPLIIAIFLVLLSWWVYRRPLLVRQFIRRKFENFNTNCTANRTKLGIVVSAISTKTNSQKSLTETFSSSIYTLHFSCEIQSGSQPERHIGEVCMRNIWIVRN